MAGTTDKYINLFTDFAFKNLHRLREMPKNLEEGIFKRLFELAEIARMEPQDRTFYEDSLKDYRDLKAAMDTSFKEGKVEGIAEGIAKGMAQGMREKAIQTAKTALQEGLPTSVIIKLTGLAAEEIETLRGE